MAVSISHRKHFFSLTRELCPRPPPFQSTCFMEQTERQHPQNAQAPLSFRWQVYPTFKFNMTRKICKSSNALPFCKKKLHSPPNSFSFGFSFVCLDERQRPNSTQNSGRPAHWNRFVLPDVVCPYIVIRDCSAARRRVRDSEVRHRLNSVAPQRTGVGRGTRRSE